MIFGFNTDVQGKDGLYHVQTEDRGARNPVVESIVYVGGKILGKKRTPYDPATWSKEQIEEAVRLQHKELMESVRNGTWQPPAHAAQADVAKGAGDGSGRTGLQVSLQNPKGFHQGEYFRFHLDLRKADSSGAAASVPLEIRWLVDGKVSEEQKLASREDGSAEVWVPAPELNQSASLIIRAGDPAEAVHVKFAITPGE